MSFNHLEEIITF